MPCYDRWYKWTKFSINAASVVLGWGVLIVRGGDLSELKSVDVLYILLILIRTAEVAKDAIPLVRALAISQHAISLESFARKRPDQSGSLVE